MKILLANKYYYSRGGDCIYAINLEKLMKDNGHEVAFFAMDYPLNYESSWKKYWPSEISFKPNNPFKLIKAFVRPFGDAETKNKFIKLLNIFNPDILHLNNIHTQLSPIIAEIAHKRKIKVIWTLHDHKLICPAYLCLNKGKICEKCIGGDVLSCYRNRCIKNSRIASLIATKESKKWNVSQLEESVDAFISPSAFLKKQMIRGGYNERKIYLLSNFIDEKKFKDRTPSRKNYYCYVGRLSEEKGIRTLLEVAKEIPMNIKIVGSGPLEKELRNRYAKYKQVDIVGFKNWDICKTIIASAWFTVMPSECYENYPLSIIESLCLGTPVLGADIGGIPELIEPGKNGELFKSGNKYELKKCIKDMFSKDYKIDKKKYVSLFASKKYLKSLIKIYREVGN